MRQELTPRQAEALRLAASGFTYRQIAVELGTAPKTARNLLAGAYEKLDVHSRAEATLAAIRLGLVVP